MRFVYVIPTGGFPLRDAIEAMDKRRPILVLESYYYISERDKEKTEAYYNEGMVGLRKVSKVVPRRLKL